MFVIYLKICVYLVTYRNVTRIRLRYTVCAKINFLRQGFRKLSSDRQTDRQTDRCMVNNEIYTDGVRRLSGDHLLQRSHWQRLLQHEHADWYVERQILNTQINSSSITLDFPIYLLTRNSSGDEIANVNFLYDDIVHVLAQLSQRDRAAGCVIVFAKSSRLELGDNILLTLCTVI